MDKDKVINWMAAVIGFLLVTIVSVVGWIALQVWEMKPKVLDTATRVDRIVDVLPEVKVRIAQEDLQKNIRAALLTTEAIQDSSGRWVSSVHWLDFVSGEHLTFKVELKGPEDPTVSYLVAGIANARAREKLSIAEYMQIAAQVGKPLPAPTYLDQGASYAIIKPSLGINARGLERVLGNPVGEGKIDKKLLKIDQLVEELKIQENEYRPKD
jgi:hypothetical protein